MRTAVTLSAVVVVLASGCSSSEPSGSGGTAGTAGTAGAGGSGNAAGSAGSAGSAGTSAAPPVAVEGPCADAADDVYVTPPGLPPHTPALRGEVLRCTTDATQAQADVQARLDQLAVGITAESGVARFRIAYRTERALGVGGVGTAQVLLPDPPPSGPLPIFVATHGTAGLADQCAPSKTAQQIDYLALGFASTGFAVIAPDYAGLGNEGVQGYGDGVDTGHSVLDAARALRKLVTPGSLSNDIVVGGHSQGGGAALAAQSLATSYGADGNVRAILAFAPGWQSTAEPEIGVYKFPNLVPTSLGAGVTAAVASLYAYADQVNGVGPASAGALFHPNVRADVVSLIEQECIVAVALGIPQLASNFAELIDPTFADGVVSCVEGPTCVEPAKGFLERQAAHFMPLDTGGAKILYLQGLADAQATPERAACYLETMATMSVTPQLCTDATATHFDIVERTLPFARQWTEAMLSGTTPPTCDDGGMPTCQ